MLVLTGASGFVGSELIPRLARPDGGGMLLVSRDAARLRALHPTLECCDYDALSRLDLAGAVFVHLAVRNNDRPGTLVEYEAANVAHLLETAAIARAGGARRFINLCTTHALQPAPDDPYGMSKAEGARRLLQQWPEGAVNLYIPAVYGERLQGRLGLLNRLPAWSRSMVLTILRQVKPVISADMLARTMVALGHVDSARVSAIGEMIPVADRVNETGVYAIGKRCMDLLAALGIFVLLGWAMVILALLIRLDSAGPAIFAQRRVGRGGRPFTCYKFRTMQAGTVEVATHHIGGQSVTRIGRLLRRSKLDELPQAFNILRNEMSLVGPRPCLPVQTELVAERAMRGVLDLKPGVTGLAQINDIDMSDPRVLAMWDARYAAFRTLLLDVVILVRTILGKGAGDRIVHPSNPSGSGLRKEGTAA